jgi:HSP20 family protein
MSNLIPLKRKHQETNDGGSLVTQPFDRSLTQLRNEVDSLVSRFWDGWPAIDDRWLQSGLGWSLDMDEKDDAYVVRAEAPGFDADDFEVDVRGNNLNIRAEHKDENKDGEQGSRYHYGRFERTTTLPPGVDAENVSARYHSGVLELRLPKKPDGRGKRITVQAS